MEHLQVVSVRLSQDTNDDVREEKHDQVFLQRKDLCGVRFVLWPSKYAHAVVRRLSRLLMES
eukprot:6487590-Amphidinium_carterae.1